MLTALLVVSGMTALAQAPPQTEFEEFFLAVGPDLALLPETSVGPMFRLGRGGVSGATGVDYGVALGLRGESPGCAGASRCPPRAGASYSAFAGVRYHHVPLGSVVPYVRGGLELSIVGLGEAAVGFGVGVNLGGGFRHALTPGVHWGVEVHARATGLLTTSGELGRLVAFDATPFLSFTSCLWDERHHCAPPP